MRSYNETTQLIRDEHKKLRGLFRQVEVIRARAPEMFHSIVDELCDELQMYIEREERLLFPEVHKVIKERSRLETDETEFIHQSIRDHREIADGIKNIRFQRTTENSSDWDDLVDDLVSVSEAYLNAEEKNLLPFIEKYLPRVDAALSEKWFDLGDQIRVRIKATTPESPFHAQNPSGGEQKRKAG